MSYFITLPTFAEIEQLFKENGYHITCDLANELLIFRNNDITESDENFIEDYTIELPEHLQTAIEQFAKDNELY